MRVNCNKCPASYDDLIALRQHEAEEHGSPGDIAQWIRDELELRARIKELESRLDTAQSDLAESEGHCKALFENLQQATTKLEKVMATPNVSLSTYEAVEAERNSAVLRLGHFQRALEGIRHMGSDNYGLLTEAAKAADFALNATEADFVVERRAHNSSDDTPAPCPKCGEETPCVPCDRES